MPKFTTISPTSKPDEKPQAWERFRDGHYVAIGWLRDTNLAGKSERQIVDLIRRGNYDDELDALYSVPRFLQLEKGDYIGVKNVNHGIFGIGRFDSKYKYEHRKHVTGWSRGEGPVYYAHYFDVKWLVVKYIAHTSFEFGRETAWRPRGTIGQIYSELPLYIKRVLES